MEILSKIYTAKSYPKNHFNSWDFFWTKFYQWRCFLKTPQHCWVNRLDTDLGIFWKFNPILNNLWSISVIDAREKFYASTHKPVRDTSRKTVFFYIWMSFPGFANKGQLCIYDLDISGHFMAQIDLNIIRHSCEVLYSPRFILETIFCTLLIFNYT